MSTLHNSSKQEVSSGVLELPMPIFPGGQILFTVNLIVPLPLLLSKGEKSRAFKIARKQYYQEQTETNMFIHIDSFSFITMILQ